MIPLDIRPVGDAAVLARLSDAIDIATVRQARALAGAIRNALKDAALDVVPAYASVFVRFNPLTAQLAEVMAAVRGAAETPSSEPRRGSDHAKPRRWTIGVCFDGESGPDLADCALALGLTPKKLVEKFCAVRFEVAFLGYLAGYPYLIGLPAELALPRLHSPRKAVAAGSVAIAERQCGIYTSKSPGGWRILGRTGAMLFDAGREPAALLAPGDAVLFEPVRDLSRAAAKAG